MHAASASPPCSVASASAWPSATRGALRIALRLEALDAPRKDASVLMRAPLMRRSSECRAVTGLEDEPAAGSFVHDMF